MQNVLDAESVRAAERRAMEKGFGEMMLRINASLAVADEVCDRARREWSRTAVFCGPGGNGCDGILIACRLMRQGCRNVRAFITCDESAISREIVAYAESCGLRLQPISEYDSQSNILIDAIYGIGLNRNVTGGVAELIRKLNDDANEFRLAVDIPSGLNADTGYPMGVAFKAHVTITFICYKPGMLFHDGRDYCGRIIVENIGVESQSPVSVFDGGDVRHIVRDKTMHKGKAGKVFVIGGCGEMIGAPILAGAAAQAAYFNGAGVVTVCLPKILRSAAHARTCMSVMKFLPDDEAGFIKYDEKQLDDIMSKAKSIDIGPGMGANPYLNRIVKYISDNYDGNLVIDADALNAIANDYAFLKNSKAKVVLTPHVGEFERMTGLEANIANARKVAEATGAIVVLKSATTVITDGERAILNISGTPAMAKAGMGDLLGGCIAALACNVPVLDAACIASYRNGMGAELAVAAYSELMLTAKDVLNFASYGELYDDK